MITIEYKESLPLPQIVAEIGLMTSPHVFLWYIGIYGLKKEGVKFYKNFLIDPIQRVQQQAQFSLVDLTAWGALRNPKVKLNKISGLVDKIESFGIGNLQIIKSSDTFQRMQQLKDKSVIEYFRMALRRDFVHRASQNTPERQIKVKDLFDQECPVMSEWYDVDAGKCYSTLQYLEGCLLIDEMVGTSLKNRPGENIEIVFALPNDELKYYWDETKAFQKDVEFLLHYRYGSLLKDVKVTFFSFEYGDEVHYRPYNAPGKVFKKNELTCNDILETIPIGVAT